MKTIEFRQIGIIHSPFKSVVRLIRIDNGNLYIQDIDVVDKTPLLDIKPYVNDFDVREVDKIGWLESKSKKVTKTSADGRFTC
jgi:tRNA (Thr-GGU) A37 N-methylase